jgi:DNA-binding PadR family transcriptional regulator
MAREEPEIPKELRSLVPMTPAVFFIMLALADGQKHGYAIMQEVSNLSDSKFRMGPGTLYTTIQRLLDLSLIEEAGGPSRTSRQHSRRRYYRLTGAGKGLLEFEVRRLESVVRTARQKKLVPRRTE